MTSRWSPWLPRDIVPQFPFPDMSVFTVQMPRLEGAEYTDQMEKLKSSKAHFLSHGHLAHNRPVQVPSAAKLVHAPVMDPESKLMRADGGKLPTRPIPFSVSRNS